MRKKVIKLFKWLWDLNNSKYAFDFEFLNISVMYGRISFITIQFYTNPKEDLIDSLSLFHAEWGTMGLETLVIFGFDVNVDQFNKYL